MFELGKMSLEIGFSRSGLILKSRNFSFSSSLMNAFGNLGQLKLTFKPCLESPTNFSVTQSKCSSEDGFNSVSSVLSSC